MINDSKNIFCTNMIKWNESYTHDTRTWLRFVFCVVMIIDYSETLLPFLALERTGFLGSSLFPLDFCHIFAKVGLPRPCGLSRPSPLALEALFEEDGLQRDGSKSCPVLDVHKIHGWFLETMILYHPWETTVIRLQNTFEMIFPFPKVGVLWSFAGG